MINHIHMFDYNMSHQNNIKNDFVTEKVTQQIKDFVKSKIIHKKDLQIVVVTQWIYNLIF